MITGFPNGCVLMLKVHMEFLLPEDIVILYKLSIFQKWGLFIIVNIFQSAWWVLNELIILNLQFCLEGSFSHEIKLSTPLFQEEGQ